MTISFRCPVCGHKLRAPADAAGKRANCKCGQPVVVPSVQRVHLGPGPSPAAVVSRRSKPPVDPWDIPEAAATEDDPLRAAEPIDPREDRDPERGTQLPGSTVSVVAIVLLAVSMAVDVLELLLHRMNDDSADDVTFLMLLRVVCLIATVIAFCCWIYRAHANLRLLRVIDLQFTPGWAVGYFFIPIVNLWRPLQVVQEIWRGSDPDGRRLDAVSRSHQSSAVAGWWWACQIASGFLGQISGHLAASGDEEGVVRFAAMLSSGLSIAAGALAIAVIRDIRNRQTLAYAHLLDRRGELSSERPVAARSSADDWDARTDRRPAKQITSLQKLGIVLMIVAVLIGIFAWTYNFPGERETYQYWDNERGGWSKPKVVRDETIPLRWGFTIPAAVMLVVGGLLVIGGAKRDRGENTTEPR